MEPTAQSQQLQEELVAKWCIVASMELGFQVICHAIERNEQSRINNRGNFYF